MISSERVLGIALGVASVLGAPWVLACGVPGDLDSMGCPRGETCLPPPMGSGIRFERAAVLPCDPQPQLAHVLWPDQLGTSTAVVLGGRTHARVLSGRWDTATFSEHFTVVAEPDEYGTVEAVATTLGPGRFSVYDADGLLVDYLAMQVMEAARVEVRDGITCPGDGPQALLRGATVHLWPVIHALDWTPLVDTAAVVRMASGELEITPGDGADVALEVVVGGQVETVTLPVVDAIDEIVALTWIIHQLRGEVPADGSWATCFQARAGDATVLGVPIDAVRFTGPYRELQFELGSEEAVELRDTWERRFPSCLLIERDPEGERFVDEGTLEIEMAGLTARYTIVR